MICEPIRPMVACRGGIDLSIRAGSAAVEHTTCLIVGGGPAGMMLGRLARYPNAHHASPEMRAPSARAP
jgi:NADPH-dependent 2,4-dienoyl-CoA reductase/sulfur reductase-like enzyme